MCMTSDEIARSDIHPLRMCKVKRRKITGKASMAGTTSHNEKSDLPVQPLLQKYFHFHLTQITSRSRAVSSHRGALAIVTNAGRDAVDVRCAPDESAPLRTAKSCGPDAPTLASSVAVYLRGEGGNKARSPGRARRKPLKPLRGECRTFPA
jgi:hypothetical protein